MWGEGLRNTIDLRGRSGIGHGPLHWSANFDEVQDFENQIRNLAEGTGLISDGIPHPPLGSPEWWPQCRSRRIGGLSVVT